jgi:hypothetical protein
VSVKSTYYSTIQQVDELKALLSKNGLPDPVEVELGVMAVYGFPSIPGKAPWHLKFANGNTICVGETLAMRDLYPGPAEPFFWVVLKKIILG